MNDRAPCRDTAPVQFIEHNAAKAGNTYEFDWTPPADASAGDVRFYVAANAANGNGQDATATVCFTANITLTPNAGGGGGPKPAISNNGVVNGATFTAGIVSGSWATIQGTDLAQNDANLARERFQQRTGSNGIGWSQGKHRRKTGRGLLHQPGPNQRSGSHAR